MKEHGFIDAGDFGLKPYAMIVCSKSCRIDETGETDANPERDFVLRLNSELKKQFDVSEPIQNVAEVWRAVFNRVPDVMIISRNFEDADPITLISKLRLSRYCMDIRFYLCCSRITDSVKSICKSNRIEDLFEFGTDAEEAAAKIFEGYAEFKAEEEKRELENLNSFINDSLFFNEGAMDKKLMKSITETMLVPIGLDPKHRGTSYLQLIIYMKVLGVEGDMSAMYLNAAQLSKTSAGAVEKAIRYSIESAWEKSSPYMQYYLFGNTVDETKGKPTNSEFIATIVQHVREAIGNGSFGTYC